MKKSLLFLAAAAVCSVAPATAGQWVDVTPTYLHNPGYIPNWSGKCGNIGVVAECYNSAFMMRQTIKNLPAGTYTFAAKAFYRCSDNAYSQANMSGTANHNAYIFANGEQTLVEGLFDTAAASYPNSMDEARAAFDAGRYNNTVTVTLAQPGDIELGIANRGGMIDEWTCFDDFTLTGPNGAVAIPNGDFSQGFNTTKGADAVNPWDAANVEGAYKGFNNDANNGNQGTWIKSNASPYDYGQLCVVPAGTYRFSVSAFVTPGLGLTDAVGVDIKNGWHIATDVTESALTNYNNGLYNDENAAYVYAYLNTDPQNVKLGEGDMGTENAYTKTKIKAIFDVDKATIGGAYPEMEPLVEPANAPEGWQHVDGAMDWEDSGNGRQAASVFVKYPEAYRNYVTITVPEGHTQGIFVGYKKDNNKPAKYCNPYNLFKLEKANVAGIQNVTADEAFDDENAPREYYNLQGARVMEPTEGLYIVRQGHKVFKVAK